MIAGVLGIGQATLRIRLRELCARLGIAARMCLVGEARASELDVRAA